MMIHSLSVVVIFLVWTALPVFCMGFSSLLYELIFVPFVSLVGWVVSTLLAGATVGSFTGGSLADKFGRTKTFVLDAIPLAVGAFLWYILLHGGHDFFNNIIWVGGSKNNA